MTPEELALDPNLLLDKSPLILYRLARARFANLSGIGAALTPGRWNWLGQEAIYTSVEVSVPVLERLAHTSKDLIPSNLALMKVHLSGNWEKQDDEFLDDNTGGRLWLYPTLAAARSLNARHLNQHHSGFEEPLAVAVPSVIVPVWNVVLYPRGRAFWNHVHLESVEPFEFDPRLFPEEALREP